MELSIDTASELASDRLFLLLDLQFQRVHTFVDHHCYIYRADVYLEPPDFDLGNIRQIGH